MLEVKLLYITCPGLHKDEQKMELGGGGWGGGGGRRLGFSLFTGRECNGGCIEKTECQCCGS